ncbi:hypothetical protein GCM10025882_31600 [Acinetobacter gyllenbergii]|uniref:Uncharacterized protein n=1 Tax=Acinetobacter gyllenbergii CIP 110306 = MTCC 11365 TaxID=1217657 RepID=A0A829HHD0_9GAMM|nr:hypothetical protein [Acinetobacter gyllenbergii]EPF81526.1 hypothetical protein F957_02067 [Acinetobacter gyllenbergii CIP 110306 = MTCC 11365]EPH31059.1 hypothetical protein L293_2462 [Acinetobacter gyllenbergii CIP 110306 = MTCC 11365]GMA12735.1 hypothetical protein GCM10025882_31600 [Acinetobacter gyllenbergii]
MKNDIVWKTTCIAGVFVLIFLIVIFTAIYSHWGDQNSQALKDSLSTTSGIFGGLATLVAACVAAYLFNDWKVQKKYEIVSTLALEAHREYIYAKDKYHFFLFQHIYGTPAITYKEVDDDFFKVIAKLNLLDAILDRFKFGIRINSEIKSTYTEGYCKVPNHYRRVENLRGYNGDDLQIIFNNAFEKDQELFKKLLDIIEKVEDKN